MPYITKHLVSIRHAVHRRINMFRLEIMFLCFDSNILDYLKKIISLGYVYPIYQDNKRYSIPEENLTNLISVQLTTYSLTD